MPEKIHHALVLNLHQPSGNLENLLVENEWEAKEILWALDRIPRSLWEHEDIAKVHLSLSGTLLETLTNQQFQSSVYGIVKCGDLLWHLQNTRLFEILGTAYYHSVLPLIPQADWEEQCTRWQGIGKHVFWRNNFSGFWPPEMGFCMEMIPMLKKLGYRYVMVDSDNVEPAETMRWEELRYQPHIARYEDSEIIVIVRDRELSDAQESGMDWAWFSREINDRVKWCDFHPLVTTITDGDNGGWFRNTSGHGNFWHAFYDEFITNVKNDTTTIRPAFITDYLNTYGARGYVNVQTAAWNTGWHSGKGFTQWTGSALQKNALDEVAMISKRFHAFTAILNPEQKIEYAPILSDIHWHILRAETSCNFFWGEAWVYKCTDDLTYAKKLLDQIESKLKI